jgi:hypothetical protein
MAADVIPIKPPSPPGPPVTSNAKRKRRPPEKFAQVDGMLGEHQRRIYEARAVIASLTTELHHSPPGDLCRVIYCLDAVDRLLSPVVCIDSFPDLIQQDEDRRARPKAW